MASETSKNHHSHDDMAITDAVIFTGDAMVENHALLIDSHGTVKDIVPNRKIITASARQSLPDHIIAPGLIDIQVNGGDNRLFNADPTPENANAIADAHLRSGTTRLLLTCITDTAETTRRAIDAVRTARPGCPTLLGTHLEGPHIAPARKGVHADSHIRPITANDIADYKPKHSDEKILITLAPENVSPAEIQALHQQGNLIAIGHTQATIEQLRTALKAGATGFTHLFNAMGGIEARNPGVAGIALDDDNSWCGIILDGYHVCAETARIAVRAKHPDKMMMVSDAMPPAAAASPKPFNLYGQSIKIESGRCVDSQGRLAGAATTLADNIRTGIKMGMAPESLLRMASTNPATFLGLGKSLGKILPGYAADCVAFDFNFNVKKVWQNAMPIDTHPLELT